MAGVRPWIGGETPPGAAPSIRGEESGKLIRHRTQYILMQPKTAMLSLRLPPDVKEALERAAKDDRRSIASLIDKIASDWLKANGYLPRD